MFHFQGLRRTNKQQCSFLHPEVRAILGPRNKANEDQNVTFITDRPRRMWFLYVSSVLSKTESPNQTLFPTQQSWTRTIRFLPASSSLPSSLAGAEPTFWLAWEAENRRSLEEGEQKGCASHAPFLLLCYQIKNLFLLRGRGEECVTGRERPGMELFILRMKHQALGVEWAGQVMLFSLKKQKQKLWCYVPTPQKIIR